MFKRSRKKIVASIMMILGIVWIGTLSVIYVSSYLEMSKQNERMLKTYAQTYVLSSAKDFFPPERPIPQGGKHGFEPGFEDSPMFKLSVFYSVALSYGGEVLEIKNASQTVHSDEELENLAKKIMEGKRESGRTKNLSYYKEEKNKFLLVVFMDNTIVNENAMTLFHFTLAFGAVALVLFFLLSVYLAKRIVQPLEESYRKQRQFISDAGHELKTPVSIVNANAELLSREIGQNQWLSNIQYENERMGILIGQLLDLARTENLVPQMESVDFSHLVSGECLPFESVAYEKGLVLTCNITEDIWVEGNSSQLKQIVAILLDNAIRHSNRKGEVFCNLTREHGCASLSVINFGDEIPKEQQESIFERFYRMDSARNGEDKHYGLGLAIAKAIATSHKGKIHVKCYNGLVEFNVKIPASEKIK